MWLVVASGNGTPGMDRAGQILREGGGALDAVEEAIRMVESNVEDDSVGLAGLPNVLGEVELDASIMDGRTLAAGAVGALKGCPHPISVARRVMERTAHVLLVGEGARRFASEMGFGTTQVLAEGARRKWRKALGQVVSDEEIDCIADRQDLLSVAVKIMDKQFRHGTVNFIARDQHGDIACGVSTSGWPWKYPSRVGDSAIIGAGNYADNRYGAAACVGYGELAMRAGTARSVVLYMRMGMSVEAACHEAMCDLRHLADAASLSIVAMDREGHPFGITSMPTGSDYLVLDDHSPAPELRERTLFAHE